VSPSATTDKPTKPLPQVSPEMAPFFDAARRHVLAVQHCAGCGTMRFPARTICSKCLSRDATWAPVSGRGTVFSFAIMHQAIHPGFAAETPYAVVVVELDEGPRLVTNIVQGDIDTLRVDMPLEAVFDEVTPEWTLVKFKPA